MLGVLWLLFNPATSIVEAPDRRHYNRARPVAESKLSPTLPLAWDSTSGLCSALPLPKMQNLQSLVCGAFRPCLNLYAASNHAGFLWLKLKCPDTRCAENCIAQQCLEPLK